MNYNMQVIRIDGTTLKSGEVTYFIAWLPDVSFVNEQINRSAISKTSLKQAF